MQIKFLLLSRIILSATLIIGEFFFVNSALAGPAPCTVEYLISEINDANSTPLTTDTIDLSPGCTYILKNIDNSIAGSNGLPVISSPIIINGHNATILRYPSAERFRLFYVAPVGNLSINDLTLTGGYSYNPAAPNDIPTNSGGAIRNDGQLAVSRSTIRRNSGREGGGIFSINDMVIKYVTIDANDDYRGLPGGAGIRNEGNAAIANTTISRNGFFPTNDTADGIFNAQGGYLEMVNSTVSGNAGCGIDNEGDLVLNHVTDALNGACAVASGGDLYTSNSIFTGGCDGTVHPTFPNVTTHASCGGPVVPLFAMHLGPLANNGGLTQTHALQPGSVAIDIVDRLCLPTDQRDVSRPQGPKCDAGAYEYVAPPP